MIGLKIKNTVSVIVGGFGTDQVITPLLLNWTSFYIFHPILSKNMQERLSFLTENLRLNQISLHSGYVKRGILSSVGDFTNQKA